MSMSLREGNMSGKVIHPDLTFCSRNDLLDDELQGSGQQNQHATIHKAGESRQAVPLIPFNFTGLPSKIQAMIFKVWLTKSGVVHAISRLCPFEETPPDRSTASNYPHRFHWGDGPCAIRTAAKPAEVLSLLLVSRQFNHIGATCFFATNHFAFSSLGEFGRFIKGMGQARSQRIQHVDLTWIGSRMGKDGKDNARTRPLQHLFNLPRLISFTIHLDESRERRKYEGDVLKAKGIYATEQHDNMRRLRALRTLQGLDYILQLRGLKSIDAWDYSSKQERKPIVDQNFLNEIRKLVTRRQFRRFSRAGLLNNLAPFLTADWSPSSKDQKTCRYFFDPPPVEEGYYLEPRQLESIPDEYHGGTSGKDRDQTPQAEIYGSNIADVTDTDRGSSEGSKRSFDIKDEDDDENADLEAAIVESICDAEFGVDREGDESNVEADTNDVLRRLSFYGVHDINTNDMASARLILQLCEEEGHAPQMRSLSDAQDSSLKLEDDTADASGNIYNISQDDSSNDGISDADISDADIYEADISEEDISEDSEENRAPERSRNYSRTSNSDQESDQHDQHHFTHIKEEEDLESLFTNRPGRGELSPEKESTTLPVVDPIHPASDSGKRKLACDQPGHIDKRQKHDGHNIFCNCNDCGPLMLSPSRVLSEDIRQKRLKFFESLSYTSLA
jgi:hypothetical protein